MPHRNAPLALKGNLRVDRGRPKAHVAAEAGISRQCLHKWHSRWQAEGEAGLQERSSRSHHTPRRTPPQLEARIGGRITGADRAPMPPTRSTDRFDARHRRRRAIVPAAHLGVPATRAAKSQPTQDRRGADIRDRSELVVPRR